MTVDVSAPDIFTDRHDHDHPSTARIATVFAITLVAASQAAPAAARPDPGPQRTLSRRCTVSRTVLWNSSEPSSCAATASRARVFRA